MVWVDVFSFSFRRHFQVPCDQHLRPYNDDFRFFVNNKDGKSTLLARDLYQGLAANWGNFWRCFFLSEGNQSVERHVPIDPIGTFVILRKRLKFYRTLRKETSRTWTHYEPRQVMANQMVHREKKSPTIQVTVSNFTVTLLGLEDGKKAPKTWYRTHETSLKLTANAPENEWLVQMNFHFGSKPIFRGELLVSGSVRW